MDKVFLVFRREFAGYFATPLGAVFLTVFLAIGSGMTFFVASFFDRAQADLSAFFLWHPWLYLVLMPAIGMRLWAEERRSGTIELLMTLPARPWQLVLGKWLAAWAFAGLALALTFPLWITVNVLGSPDNGTILTAYLGSLLLAGSFLAITSMTSAMTRNQAVSFILSVRLCLLLEIAGYSPVTDLLTRWTSPAVVSAVASFSVMTHFDALQRGVIDLRDVGFFLSVIGFALFGNAVIVRGLRAG